MVLHYFIKHWQSLSICKTDQVSNYFSSIQIRWLWCGLWSARVAYAWACRKQIFGFSLINSEMHLISMEIDIENTRTRDREIGVSLIGTALVQNDTDIRAVSPLIAQIILGWKFMHAPCQSVLVASCDQY